MNDPNDESCESAVEKASGFDAAQIASYEPYLRMLARIHMRSRYQARLGVSDVIQQTMLQAVQAIGQFRGETEAELRCWLRQILVRQMCHLDRDLHRDKRDIRREQSIEQQLAKSSTRLEGLLRADQATPSQIAIVGEQVVGLAHAVESLPDAQRDAIVLHYLEGMKLADVATQLDKTTGAIAGLLHRGMKQLRANLAGVSERHSETSPSDQDTTS